MEQIGWFYNVSWNFPLFVQHVEHESFHAYDIQDSNMISFILPLKEKCRGRKSYSTSFLLSFSCDFRHPKAGSLPVLPVSVKCTSNLVIKKPTRQL